MKDYLAKLTRFQKGALVLISDSVMIIIAFFCALSLRLNTLWPDFLLKQSLWLILLAIVSGLVLAIILRIHQIKLSTFEASAQLRIGQWVFLLSGFITIANILFTFGIPRTVPIIMGFLLFVFSVGLRYLILSYFRYNDTYKRRKQRAPVAVYGAGAGGMQLISSLKESSEYRLALLIDDNKNLHNVIIGGLRVISPSKLTQQIAAKKIEKIFLAAPKISQSRKIKILSDIKQLGCELKELPSYTELIESGDILKSLKSVSTDDLLGRSGVEIDMVEIDRTYAGKNVLVSGAGGSIGSELCRKIAEIGPKQLVLFEMSEVALYQIELELSSVAREKSFELVSILGSVVDSSRIKTILTKYDIDVVVHAAAYKHVPLIEHNENEAGRNNILGTLEIAKASLACKIERFILVSTDKAVRPTNVMGASKRFAELIVQGMDKKSKKTIFSIVRFGNVLGSSGSVVPLFKEQIANGGPVTLTHPDVTRYFMTISEATKLVLLAGSFAEGGEVFLLEMGKPIKISALAKQMIELSGLTIRDEKNPDGDIEINVTGLRPGEKLYEELLIGENTLSTPHPKIMRALETKLNGKQLALATAQIKRAINLSNEKMLRNTLLKWVDGYQSKN